MFPHQTVVLILKWSTFLCVLLCWAFPIPPPINIFLLNLLSFFLFAIVSRNVFECYLNCCKKQQQQQQQLDHAIIIFAEKMKQKLKSPFPVLVPSAITSPTIKVIQYDFLEFCSSTRYVRRYLMSHSWVTSLLRNAAMTCFTFYE